MRPQTANLAFRHDRGGIGAARRRTARLLRVDNDPIVLLHAHALLTSAEPGATSYIEADLRDTAKILEEAARLLDFTQPTAVMLVAIGT